MNVIIEANATNTAIDDVLSKYINAYKLDKSKVFVSNNEDGSYLIHAGLNTLATNDLADDLISAGFKVHVNDDGGLIVSDKSLGEGKLSNKLKLRRSKKSSIPNIDDIIPDELSDTDKKPSDGRYKIKNESLPYDDYEEEGELDPTPFIEDGKEYTWLLVEDSHETPEGDEWEVRSAVLTKTPDDDAPDIYYFVVDPYSDFIDWGPCDTLDEAKEFMYAKDNDCIDEDDYESLMNATVEVDDSYESRYESLSDYKFLVKCNDGPEILVRVVANNRDDAERYAKAMYAEEHTTYADERQNDWVIKDIYLSESFMEATVEVDGDYIVIKGKKGSEKFKPINGDPQKTLHSFNGIMKHSQGRAWQWLKKQKNPEDVIKLEGEGAMISDAKYESVNDTKVTKCCICGAEIANPKDSHNADPVCKNGRCCTKCNYSVVVPKRFKLSSGTHEIEAADEQIAKIQAMVDKDLQNEGRITADSYRAAALADCYVDENDKVQRKEWAKLTSNLHEDNKQEAFSGTFQDIDEILAISSEIGIKSVDELLEFIRKHKGEDLLQALRYYRAELGDDWSADMITDESLTESDDTPKYIQKMVAEIVNLSKVIPDEHKEQFIKLVADKAKQTRIGYGRYASQKLPVAVINKFMPNYRNTSYYDLFANDAAYEDKRPEIVDAIYDAMKGRWFKDEPISEGKVKDLLIDPTDEDKEIIKKLTKGAEDSGSVDKVSYDELVKNAQKYK